MLERWANRMTVAAVAGRQSNSMRNCLLAMITIALLSAPGVRAQSIEAMTYNIRLDTPTDGENAWAARKEGLAAQLLFHEPDVIGVQEALFHQVAYLDASLVDYAYVGVGRDDGLQGGEFSALFYDTGRLRVLEEGTFWLSESPDEISIGWDAALPRICTYARFEDLRTSRKFWVFNTHFDHQGAVARERSAALIIARIDEMNMQDEPVMLMGDLNSVPESAPIATILAQMDDTRQQATLVRFGPDGTVRFKPDRSASGFDVNQPVTRRLDYIFTSKGDWQVLKYAVLTDSKNLKYYSDHLAVYVEATAFGGQTGPDSGR